MRPLLDTAGARPWRTPRCIHVLVLFVFSLGPIGTAAQAQQGPLELESRIPLGTVKGRIDHLAVDLGRKHLFVAELENNSVGIVDLDNGRLLHRITGLQEPQGVGYVPTLDTLIVANAGDGSVRFFRDNTNPTMIKWLAGRNDGQLVNYDF